MSRSQSSHDASSTQHLLNRRQFLRAGSAALALPFLEALAPRLARGASQPPPKRMVCIMTNTGLLPENFWPKETGKTFEPSRYLAHLEQVRGRYSVMNGLSHPDNSGGHVVEKSFLTGARFPSSAVFKNSISVDQLAVESLGHHTRFPFLALGVNGQHDGLLSVSREGVFIPPELSPAKVYQRLFTPDTAAESEQRMREIGQRVSTPESVQDSERMENGGTRIEDGRRAVAADASRWGSEGGPLGPLSGSETQVDPTTWRSYTVRLQDARTGWDRFDITLLRPQGWLAEHSRRVAGRSEVWVDFEELHAKGWAEVI
jgi:hypothetical protein